MPKQQDGTKPLTKTLLKTTGCPKNVFFVGQGEENFRDLLSNCYSSYVTFCLYIVKIKSVHLGLLGLNGFYIFGHPVVFKYGFYHLFLSI